MNRIAAIEGLRGLLALWVLGDHVLALSGYAVADLSGPLWLLRQGWYAVDVFMVISGFVIFYLLDHRAETYREFIVRRFFRLWPLFAVLFVAAIPLSLIQYANASAMLGVFPGGFGFVDQMARIDSCWQNIAQHIAAHALMLHGAIPDQVLPHSSGAFLGPAWSISLEWQFYLVAPLAFGLSRSRLGVVLVALTCFLLYRISPRLPSVAHGAFLPMHIEYFFIGGLLYFVYRRGWLGWVPAWVALPFNNSAAQYLGRISYSLYLSHHLVLVLSQWVLISALPGLHQSVHGALLGGIGLVVAVAVSGSLYRLIEQPGMRIGSAIAQRLRHRDQVRGGGAVVRKV